MGKDPDAIRHEIEQTRADMGDTLEAIGDKADVPARAREAVSGKIDTAKEKARGAASRIGQRAGQTGSRLSEAAPDAGEVKQATRRAVGIAQENPLGLAIGATALGFLAGLLLPKTRVEDQRLGQLADQVKDTVQQTGQEAMERGRQVAQAAAQTASQQARKQGRDLAGSTRSRAGDLGQQAPPGSS
jgi:ElaB/YqjD/DUF883 family membrane-anchored ribosome-binding protein